MMISASIRINGSITVQRYRHECWGLSHMTPFQVFTGTFILVLIFAALVAFLTLNASHASTLMGV